MKGSNTIFQSDRNKLAALTGKGAPNPVAPTYATTMTIDPDAGMTQKITATGNATLNALNGGLPGQALIIQWLASGGTRTATFGTNFLSVGTAAPTTGKIMTVVFISDGTNFIEVCRPTAGV